MKAKKPKTRNPFALHAKKRKAGPMKLKRNTKDKESKEFWDFVDETAKEVEGWPDWKKDKQGEPTEEPTFAAECYTCGDAFWPISDEEKECGNCRTKRSEPKRKQRSKLLEQMDKAAKACGEWPESMKKMHKLRIECEEYHKNKDVELLRNSTPPKVQGPPKPGTEINPEEVLEAFRRSFGTKDKLRELEERIANLEAAQWTNMYRTYSSTEFDFCKHEYPDTWMGTVPPCCTKCGKPAPMWKVSY